MREKSLHFIWENQYFDKSDLRTVQGDEIFIQNVGKYNMLDAGPDFNQGGIILNGIKWVGQIEIHIKSSDWMKHGHQDDTAYANVILHVVYDHDMEIKIAGKTIPTLELRNIVPTYLLHTIDELENRSGAIACESLINRVNDLKVRQWLDRLATDRLQRKSNEVIQQLDRNKGDWEATYVNLLCKYMGFKVNNESFLMLSNKIHWRWIQKNAHDLLKLQAYFYGIAGFLNESPADKYEKSLSTEFKHLKRLLGLQELPSVVWKFSRMRPSNYPTVRIAQLIALFHAHTQLFPSILQCESLDDFYKHFGIEYPEYWQEHYAMGKESKRKREVPGNTSIQSLLINVLSPVLFAYGEYKNRREYCDRAIKLWQDIPPEKNRIIRKWEKINIIPENAWDTQALIRLFSRYCLMRNCLECQIGKAILHDSMSSYVKQSAGTTYSKIVEGKTL